MGKRHGNVADAKPPKDGRSCTDSVDPYLDLHLCQYLHIDCEPRLAKASMASTCPEGLDCRV